MKLQEITANIRLRSTWEAIDMGFAMVQTWWKAVYFPLAIVTFTIATALFFIVPGDDFWIAGLIFWWLKPLFDRIVLHIISHKLFNEELTSWQALKKIPFLIWNTGFFQTMTFRRFSMSRGFNLPIWQLEQLRGAQRADRQRVLHLAAHSQASWLTIAMVHLEMILVISLFALIALFLPENILNDFFEGLFSQPDVDRLWLDYLNYFFYVSIVTLLHPFYIAGNFALYINRRTQLEAWDLELDFRKLSIRIKDLLKATPPLLILFMVWTGLAGTPNTALADEITITQSISNDKTEFLENERKPAEASKKVIEEVMLTENLNDKKIVKRWVKKKLPKKKQKDKSDSDYSNFWKIVKNILEPIAVFIGTIIEFGLWILIAIGLFLLFYFRDRWLYLFQGGRKIKDEYQAPDIMFGMDVRKESLPEDIISEVKKLWEANQHREALSLLYRGALVRLINQEQVKLEDSYTEGDVLRHAGKQLNANKQRYLNNLTTQWKLIAYAHRSPLEPDMQLLFNHWNSDFAIDTEIKVNAEAKGERNE